MARTNRGKLVLALLIFCVPAFAQYESHCEIPLVMRKRWFSRENGENTMTEINDKSMTNRGNCIEMAEKRRSGYNHYTFLFKKGPCFYCVTLIVRTVNVLEKIESTCIDSGNGLEPTIENVCGGLREDKKKITLFSEHYVPVNCRSSLEGMWHFASQNRHTSMKECNNPDAMISACQTPFTHLSIMNKKFSITYASCPNVTGTSAAVVEYICLGSWSIGKNRFFAVANPRETRRENTYRCFLKNFDDDLYLGVSSTAECNILKNVKESPELLRITAAEFVIVEPECSLPRNMSGEWINTAFHDAEVVINETHITETWNAGEGRIRKIIYVCQEKRGNRIMMARLSNNGCRKDYVCFYFIPGNHNVIRYVSGRAYYEKDFPAACSWSRFPRRVDRNDDLLLAKNPIPVTCPFAGDFQFDQKGEIRFETRNRVGFTILPRNNETCAHGGPHFTVCDSEQKQILINEYICFDGNYSTRDPDRSLTCVGFWKEDDKSYLITYEEREASPYRCWVYMKENWNTILMSQSFGSYCSPSYCLVIRWCQVLQKLPLDELDESMQLIFLTIFIATQGQRKTCIVCRILCTSIFLVCRIQHTLSFRGLRVEKITSGALALSATASFDNKILFEL